MNTSSAANYEFGNFRIEVSRRRLLRRGEAVPLTPKLFDTLLHLVQNNDRVCEKEELMQALWPDTAVEDNNLNQTILPCVDPLARRRRGTAHHHRTRACTDSTRLSDQHQKMLPRLRQSQCFPSNPLCSKTGTKRWNWE
jgi:hypothetical protein